MPRRFAAIASLVSLLAPSAVRAEELVDHVVGPGENCESISAKVFGDPQAFPILHTLNPQLGPTPHNLKPGTVLRVPKPGPDAHLTFLRNKVEAATPAPHPGSKNEPLLRGHKVSTQQESSAELTFKDQTRLQLGAETLVIVLGSTYTNAAKKSAADTTLLKGSLRAHLGELSGKKPASIATPGAKVDLSTGEAKLHVDDASTTRLAVYAGKGTLAAAGKSVEVPAGFGSKALLGKAPTPPKPLPAPPAWTNRFPRMAITTGDTLDLVGDAAARYEAGKGSGPAPTKWHVQLARDARFNDLVVDALVGLDVTKVEAKGLPPGTYHARVSAYDGDQFEGPYGEPLVLTVVSAKVIEATLPSGDLPGTLAAVQFVGAPCGVDDGAPADTSAPSPLVPGKDHLLRCATPDGATTELKLSATLAGPLLLTAREEWTTGGARKVTLRARDVTGAPVDGLTVTTAADPGLALSPVAAGPLGTYWAVAPSKGAGKVRFVVAGNEAVVQLTEKATDAAPLPAPPASGVARTSTFVGLGAGVANAGDVLGTGFSARLELGGSMPVGRHALGLGARVGVDRFSPSSFGERTLAGSIVRVALPVSFAFLVDGVVSPYVGASLGLRLAQVSATPGSVGGAGRFAVEGIGFVGVDVALVGRARLFGELFYQASPAIAFASGTLDPKGAGGVLGVRVSL